MSKLILSTLKTFLFGIIALGILLFLPAWTLRYWQAWVFILVFLTCVSAIGVYLSLQDPALLEKRKKVGPAAETSPVQKIIMSFAVIGIVTIVGDLRAERTLRVVISALVYIAVWRRTGRPGFVRQLPGLQRKHLWQLNN